MCTKYRGLMFLFEQMSRNGSYIENYRFTLKCHVKITFFFEKINIDISSTLYLYDYMDICKYTFRVGVSKRGILNAKPVSRFFIFEDISKGSVHRKHHRKTRNNIHNLLNKNHTSLHNSFNFSHLYIKKIGQICK